MLFHIEVQQFTKSCTHPPLTDKYCTFIGFMKIISLSFKRVFFLTGHRFKADHSRGFITTTKDTLQIPRVPISSSQPVMSLKMVFKESSSLAQNITALAQKTVAQEKCCQETLRAENHQRTETEPEMYRKTE